MVRDRPLASAFETVTVMRQITTSRYRSNSDLAQRKIRLLQKAAFDLVHLRRSYLVDGLRKVLWGFAA
jgi:hypothetical protein